MGPCWTHLIWAHAGPIGAHAGLMLGSSTTKIHPPAAPAEVQLMFAHLSAPGRLITPSPSTPSSACRLMLDSSGLMLDSCGPCWTHLIWAHAGPIGAHAGLMLGSSTTKIHPPAAEVQPRARADVHLPAAPDVQRCSASPRRPGPARRRSSARPPAD